MHELDMELIQYAEQMAKYAKAGFAAEVRDLIQRYREAARMSDGQDVMRSRYWASVAYERERDLRYAVGLRRKSMENE